MKVEKSTRLIIELSQNEALKIASAIRVLAEGTPELFKGSVLPLEQEQAMREALAETHNLSGLHNMIIEALC